MYRTYILVASLARASNCIQNRIPGKEDMAKENSAFMKPLKVSAELAAVVGNGPMPRSEVVKKLWVYIKGKNLQDPKNKRNIVADEALKKVFGGKAVVNMFEMTKLVSAHLS
jgi:chromatin remodeling complex protein RSC6